MNDQLSLYSSAFSPRQNTVGPRASTNSDLSASYPQHENAGLFSPTNGNAVSASPPQLEEVGHLASTQIYAVDPGQREGATIIYPDGQIVVKDFLEFTQELEPGDLVATESTMHAYRPTDRKDVIEAAEFSGAQLWGMRSIFTSRARKELGLDKSDEADAKSILHYFNTRRNLFYRLQPTPARLGTINEPGTPRFEVNRRLVMMRRDGYRGYDGHIEATVAVVAAVAHEFKLSSRAFDRLLGFHAAGYPNIARSNRNKHGAGKDEALRPAKMRDIRRAARKWYSCLRNGQ